MLHLHNNVKFTGLKFKTVEKSLLLQPRPDLSAELFRYLKTVRVTAATGSEFILDAKHISFSLKRVGQTSNFIHLFSTLQSPVFMINSRFTPNLMFWWITVYYKTIIKSSFSRSYRVIWPSSLNLIIPSTYVDFYKFTCVGFSMVFIQYYKYIF